MSIRVRSKIRTRSDGSSSLVELPACEARRARRDVLRLTGDAAGAEALHEHLLADLAGRQLPPAAYEESG